MEITIKRNLSTGNKRCQFEINHHMYYAYQNKSPLWTAIYKEDSNVMRGIWVTYADSTPIEKLVNEFTMTSNKYEDVTTYGGEIS